MCHKPWVSAWASYPLNDAETSICLLGDTFCRPFKAFCILGGWEGNNSLCRCSEYKTSRNIQGLYFWKGVNWEVIIDWDHASFLNKNYYKWSNNTWPKHCCYVGGAEMCVFLDAVFHLAVKILACPILEVTGWKIWDLGINFFHI